MLFLEAKDNYDNQKSLFYNCFIANSISLKCRRPFQVTTFHLFGVMQRSLVFLLRSNQSSARLLDSRYELDKEELSLEEEVSDR